MVSRNISLAFLRPLTNILFVILFIAVVQTFAAPQELFTADNETTITIHNHQHDADGRHQPQDGRRPAFTATALSGGSVGYQNNIFTGGNNQSAENMRDAQAGTIECYRCMPHRDNDYCNGHHVGEKVECLTGRCLIFGARVKRTKHVSRLYMCDTHNIGDWAFQVLRTSLELKPNTCEEINYDLNNTISLFQNYGLGPSIADLARIDRSDMEKPGVLADSVDALEMCTCNTMLCNSPEALRQMSALKHDELHGRGRSSAISQFSNVVMLQVLASAFTLLLTNVLRQN